MSLTWTTEQVLALAPDESSAKAGRDLSTPRKWVTLGRGGGAAWGEHQGSGRTPYQTQIDLGEPAFHCTCPSRKFPCKHALGLFLLLAGQPGAFPEGDPPPWVSDWLAGRARRTEQKETKAAKKAEAAAEEPVDAAAQARRAARREARVDAGIKELGLWVADLVRGGLAAAQGQPYTFWEGMAARLVDAQAPGLARLVRDLASVPGSGPGWQERLLERLGRIHLLLEGYSRLDTLPAETQTEIRALVGFTQNQEEVLAGEGVRDAWAVLGQRVEQEEHVRAQRTWLWGRDSGRAALIFHFAAGPAPLDTTLVPGTLLDAELVFFPGAYPLRALVQTRHGAPDPIAGLRGYATLAHAAEARAAALAHSPWASRFPVLLETVVPLRRGDDWVLRDTEGGLLAVAPRFEQGWQLLALSGGRPLTLFGEWEDGWVLPMGALAEGRFHLW